jgi:fluoride exporter
MSVLALLWIGLGSAIGGLGRYLISGLVARRVGETFPWGTLVVNLSGALLIGMLAGAGALALDGARQFLIIGVLGSYTTVSSFSFQTLALAREGETGAALANILLSLAGCLAAAALGYLATRALLGA